MNRTQTTGRNLQRFSFYWAGLALVAVGIQPDWGAFARLPFFSADILGQAWHDELRYSALGLTVLTVFAISALMVLRSAKIPTARAYRIYQIWSVGKVSQKIFCTTAAAIAVAQTFHSTYPRRFAFFLIMAPFAVSQIQRLKNLWSSLDYYPRVALVFVCVCMSIKIIPGGYLPPFSGGICGWTTYTSPDDPTVRVSGLKLISHDGGTVWFSNALSNPQNFLGRQFFAVRDNPAALQQAYEYYRALYLHYYPTLKTGRLPNQRWLGKFAYPGHNPYSRQNYREFPPESIQAIGFFDEYYDWNTQKLVKRDSYFRYSYVEKRFVN